MNKPQLSSSACIVSVITGGAGQRAECPPKRPCARPGTRPTERTQLDRLAEATRAKMRARFLVIPLLTISAVSALASDLEGIYKGRGDDGESKLSATIKRES